MQKLEFITTKGYYLENTSDIAPYWSQSSSEYILFPELNQILIKGYTAYKFNKNLSFSAIEIQTGRQIISTASLVIELNYNYFIIDNQVELTGTKSFQKSSILETNLQLG